ncbi:arginase family protein [Moraxella sp. ZJ142]|uniref:arginase family protein n=1 Tax=Moraxella marmotae TaxID=3344520 RepID=UPI0035D4DE98
MNIELIEVYSDIGAGKHGTVHGVDMLSKHCEQHQPAAVHKIFAQPVDESPKQPSAKYIEHLLPFFQDKLMPTVQGLLDNSKQSQHFPVIISGDHSNAIGNLAAFMNHHKDARIGVVWIDAHADLHSVYTTPSGNMHGMPLATALRLDNLDCQINTPDANLANQWQSLKALSTHAGIRPSDVFFLGLRSYEAPEEHIIASQQIFAYSAQGASIGGNDSNKPLTVILDQLIDKLQTLDAVYVSFDVDALDASLIPATGTPEPHGYTADETRSIFDALLGLDSVKLFEITEFNPTLDDDSDKHQTIFALLDYALDRINQRQA